MGSFGERLRREREMRGITIEEIAEATKIGSRNLRALEEEKFDLLPGGIFNKGFVRAYSKYLGLDEEQAVADYIAAETSFQQAASEGPDQPVAVTPSRSFAAPIAVVIVVVVALGGFFGWRFVKSKAMEIADRQPPATTQPAPTPPQTAATQPVSTAPAAATPSDTSPDPHQPATSPSVSPASTTPTTTPDPTATASADGFVVLLKAKQDSWVSAKADGKSVFSATLKAQNEKTLKARNRIEVMLGNAGGIQVSYNGKDLNLPNTSGQVKTLVFTPQGLQPDKPE